MQLIKMRCNNCDAQLEIDLDNLQAYCPYCNEKLLIDVEQLSLVLAEKEKTKRTNKREDEKTQRQKMSNDYQARENDKDRKMGIIAYALPFIMLLVIFFVTNMNSASYSASYEKRRDENLQYLQQLESEIEEAINEEDYDSALIKANKLHCDEDLFSDEQVAMWDDKRESLIVFIEEKKKESEIQNPEYIFMPADSKFFKGKNYNEVVDQFKMLGFTNITAQSASKNAGLFHPENTIEHILVGGKTEFTIEDYFYKDTPIIIYYYSRK